MRGFPPLPAPPARDEGERPFWISYADLMTALMMLFLVVMAVALVSVSSRGARHEQAIDACMHELATMAASMPHIQVSVRDRRVRFGERARFAHDAWRLEQADAHALRAFLPVILGFANSPHCGQGGLLRQVVVAGHTSSRGSYFYNLNLSLMRAQEVMCVLLDPAAQPPLDAAQARQVRELFVVGGYSYKDRRESEEASRRVELQLEFLDLDEAAAPLPPPDHLPLGNCPLPEQAIDRP